MESSVIDNLKRQVLFLQLVVALLSCYVIQTSGLIAMFIMAVDSISSQFVLLYREVATTLIGEVWPYVEPLCRVAQAIGPLSLDLAWVLIGLCILAWEGLCSYVSEHYLFIDFSLVTATCIHLLWKEWDNRASRVVDFRSPFGLSEDFRQESYSKVDALGPGQFFFVSQDGQMYGSAVRLSFLNAKREKVVYIVTARHVYQSFAGTKPYMLKDSGPQKAWSFEPRVVLESEKFDLVVLEDDKGAASYLGLKAAVADASVTGTCMMFSPNGDDETPLVRCLGTFHPSRCEGFVGFLEHGCKTLPGYSGAPGYLLSSNRVCFIHSGTHVVEGHRHAAPLKPLVQYFAQVGRDFVPESPQMREARARYEPNDADSDYYEFVDAKGVVRSRFQVKGSVQDMRLRLADLESDDDESLDWDEVADREAEKEAIQSILVKATGVSWETPAPPVKRVPPPLPPKPTRPPPTPPPRRSELQLESPVVAPKVIEGIPKVPAVQIAPLDPQAELLTTILRQADFRKRPASPSSMPDCAGLMTSSQPQMVNRSSDQSKALGTVPISAQQESSVTRSPIDLESSPNKGRNVPAISSPASKRRRNRRKQKKEASASKPVVLSQ